MLSIPIFSKALSIMVMCHPEEEAISPKNDQTIKKEGGSKPSYFHFFFNED